MQDKLKSKLRREGKRSINVTDVSTSDDHGGSDEFSSSDLESAIEYQVFKAMQKMDPSVRMDGNSFKELSVDAKKAWARLSSKDKSVILQASKDEASSLKVNVAESEVVSEDQNQEDEESENKTEVNMAQSDGKSKAHPGNINRMLSSSANSKSKDKDKDKKKSSSSASRSVNTVKWQVSNVNWTPTNDGDSDDEEYGEEPPPLLSRPETYYSSSSDEDSESEDEDSPPRLQAHRSSNGSVYSDSEDDSLPDLKEAAPGMDYHSSSEEEEDGDETEGQWKAYATKFDDPWEDVDYADNEHEESDFGWGG
jgi:hypothetical protein